MKQKKSLPKVQMCELLGQPSRHGRGHTVCEDESDANLGKRIVDGDGSASDRHLRASVLLPTASAARVWTMGAGNGASVMAGHPTATSMDTTSTSLPLGRWRMRRRMLDGEPSEGEDNAKRQGVDPRAAAVDPSGTDARRARRRSARI
jgi:hypothetical protein